MTQSSEGHFPGVVAQAAIGFQGGGLLPVILHQFVVLAQHDLQITTLVARALVVVELQIARKPSSEGTREVSTLETTCSATLRYSRGLLMCGAAGVLVKSCIQLLGHLPTQNTAQKVTFPRSESRNVVRTAHLLSLSERLVGELGK